MTCSLFSPASPRPAAPRKPTAPRKPNAPRPATPRPERLEIDGLDIPVELVRSKRKTVALQVRPSGEVVVRAPLRTPRKQVDRFVEEHRDWIVSTLEKVQTRRAQTDAVPKLTPDELLDLGKRARAIIPMRVAWFAPLAGVSYGRIAIRAQKTRWGSCSAKGNLNFNCLLMLAPPEVLDYVVVHELCHRLQMNHSPRFWTEVERVLPGYREQRRWLKQHGPELMARVER